MPASTEDLIAINGLLIEREAKYARVGEIEASINQLLDGDYPFPPPEHIPPSTRKRKAPKRKKAAATKATPGPKLRRLRTGEFAYRIHWRNSDGTESQSEITEFKAIDTLIKSLQPGAKPLQIETLDLENEVVDCLYSTT
ncbi:MAG: hypothetical protein ACPGKS_01645 [Coraliomargarita sp.]